MAEVTAEKKSDKLKNYALTFAIILSVILLYLIKNQLHVSVTGMQLLTILVVGMGGLYLYKRRTAVKMLPPADVMAREIAEWFFKNYGKPIDYHDYERKDISEQKALIYFPCVSRTFTYQANVGVVGVEYKDLEQSIRAAEERGITKRLIEKQTTVENLVAHLEKKGFEVDSG